MSPATFADQTVANSDFERTVQLEFARGPWAGAQAPENWILGSGATPGSFTVDSTVAHSGSHSIHYHGSSDDSGGYLLQFIDAKGLRDHWILLSVETRTDLKVGASASFWLVGTAPNLQPATGNLLFPGLGHLAVVGAGKEPWQRKTQYFYVDHSISTLVFGIYVEGGGDAWIDDLDIQKSNTPIDLPSDSALKYFDSAFSLIRDNALVPEHYDWDQVKRVARQHISGAQKPSDVYPVLYRIVRGLNDNHSTFLPPSPSNSDSTGGHYPIVSRMIGRYAYLLVPPFESGNQKEVQGYAEDMQARISKLASEAPCGWIIDLRWDTGGDMGAMEAGLGPLLGNGIFGYFENNKGQRITLTYRDGNVVSDAQNEKYQYVSVASPISLTPKQTLAVLTSQRTASSGEMAAISLRGLTNSRSFGQPTMGVPTARETYTLSDRAMLVLAVGKMLDRAGNVYSGPVVPDQVIDQDHPPYGPVVDAATSWLQTQASACGRQ